MWTTWFPSSCILCGATLNSRVSLCQSCEQGLPVIEAACQRCGLALGAHGSATALCGQCISHPPPFAHCYALGSYEFPFRELIAGFKFHGRFNLGKVLAQLLAQRLKLAYGDSPPDALLPVPLHVGRLRDRGFNQSIEIARCLSRHLGVPSCPLYCRREHASKPQRGLSATERMRNVKGIFTLVPQVMPIKPRHITIVDDVVTTMATVKAIACLLQSEGIERVDIACLARVS